MFVLLVVHMPGEYTVWNSFVSLSAGAQCQKQAAPQYLTYRFLGVGERFLGMNAL